jgi:hypothetical protein
VEHHRAVLGLGLDPPGAGLDRPVEAAAAPVDHRDPLRGQRLVGRDLAQVDGPGRQVEDGRRRRRLDDGDDRLGGLGDRARRCGPGRPRRSSPSPEKDFWGTARPSPTSAAWTWS